ncbi:carboxy-S-adenosyl-L-methionine synthase CmoA [Marinospirillum alkaliphilum]|uniref:Carboxy-S-adenosyl-L-methionine synthase n=1 Tax=Marinospirillum alkaliphilum DSM 21637 TaxID=1122209 RepID=A0A1K1ZGT1_9GAMM|nr:carboxy-S-adenosyl-L-methionine synthase CmoA [Marinospirillum alkaliphilum]SFX73361.1 tRNA (cmo5U34)-methyltransferase [Marinospirillum alkaliphilum DSM 21637]
MNKNSIPRDALFANPLDRLASFSFDEQVVQVFPDMIKRSVPGYSQILGMAGVIARRYVPEAGRVYDLGASLGAATLSVAQQLDHLQQLELIAVDNSPAMSERCRSLLAETLPQRPVEVVCADIRTLDYQPCDLILLNFTLQFLPPADRLPLMQRLFQALRPGGALILSEKVHFSDPRQAQLLYELHHDFKRANGYSDMEISQKRTALEDVLRTDTAEVQLQRLQDCGFSFCSQWFQYLNFASFLAIKGDPL